MSRSYIPEKDNAFRTWVENFACNISADPYRFGLTPSDAESIQYVVDDFCAKFAIASNEDTRKKDSIADKDDARAVATALCRQYAMQIKGNAGVSDGDKINVGVRPINPARNPIAPPTSFPVLKLLGSTPGQQTMRYCDCNTPDSRAKPFGSVGMQLYLAITDNEPAPQSEAAFHDMCTRNPVTIDFDKGDDGKLATYYARWVSAKGEKGPWSLPVSMRIAA